ncbi:porin [Alphaproteobacteria bacterium]|nr:porin [Alphaproteobacteria bacterium]
MNKLLIGTAAAALMVSPAVAGPMAVTVGGYYNAVVYSQDSDALESRDVGIHNDAEIIFKGKGKTKNGLEVGFQVQLEAEGAGESDHIDENYIYVKGDFGKVEIGAENNAAYKQQVAAPKIFGWKTYDNNFKTWGAKRIINGSEVKNSKFDKPLMDGIDSDALKINYYSPKINGFQFSYSLTPDTSDTNGDTDLYSDSGSGSASAYGVKYSGKISGLKVKASYGFNELDEDTGEATAEDTAMGLSVSSGKITVGGNMQTVDRAGAERDILHYGIEYKLSKATKVGLIMHDQEEDNGDELTIMAIGGSTKLGAGTTLTYSYETLEDDAQGDSTFMGVGLLIKF